MINHNVLVTENNDVIALRYVESIHLLREPDDLTVDILREDILMDVTTVSGRCYTISIKHQIDVFNKGISHKVAVAKEEIFEKWIYLIGENNGNPT